MHKPVSALCLAPALVSRSLAVEILVSASEKLPVAPTMPIAKKVLSKDPAREFRARTNEIPSKTNESTSVVKRVDHRNHQRYVHKSLYN